MLFKTIRKYQMSKQISYKRIEKMFNTFGALGFDAIIVAAHPTFKDAKLACIVSEQDIDSVNEAYLVSRRLCNQIKGILSCYGLEFTFSIKKKAKKYSEKGEW